MAKKKETDLNTLDEGELLELQKAVGKAIADLEEKARKEALEKVTEVASELGFKVEELLGGKGTRGKGKTRPPKYRHPEDHEKTWSGRGRKPDWVKEFEADGGNLAVCLIAA